MSKELNSDQYADLRLLIRRFVKLENEQAMIIRKMREVTGNHIAEAIDLQVIESTNEKLDVSDDFIQGIYKDEFPNGLETYLDNLQEEWSQYDYEKGKLRVPYLQYMTGLGYTEKEVVNTYNDLIEETEHEDETVLEVLTRDRLEMEKKDGSPK